MPRLARCCRVGGTGQAEQHGQHGGIGEHRCVGFDGGVAEAGGQQEIAVAAGGRWVGDGVGAGVHNGAGEGAVELLAGQCHEPVGATQATNSV